MTALRSGGALASRERQPSRDLERQLCNVERLAKHSQRIQRREGLAVEREVGRQGDHGRGRDAVGVDFKHERRAAHLRHHDIAKQEVDGLAAKLAQGSRGGRDKASQPARRVGANPANSRIRGS